jgi:hypothetical protein
METIALPVPPLWHAVAAYCRFPDVRAFVLDIVERYVFIGPGRFVPVLPLVWRMASFHVLLAPGVDSAEPLVRTEVSGPISGPFGIFRGKPWLPRSPKGAAPGFLLVHLPTGRRMIHLGRLSSCKALAEALAGLRLRLDLDVAEEVILGQPDADKVPAIFEHYRRSDLSPQQRERGSLLPEFLRSRT